MNFSELNESLFGVPARRPPDASASAEPVPAPAPVQSTTLVDDQLIRLAGESIPLTAVSGVAVTARRNFKDASVFFLGFFSFLFVAAALPHIATDFGTSLFMILLGIGFGWLARWGHQMSYTLRINLNNGRMIGIACASSQSAFAGRSELETALAERPQRVIR